MVLMGPWSRILFLGWVLGCFAAVAGAQLPSAPPPGRSTIPLARIPRVSRAPRLDDFLQDKPREAVGHDDGVGIYLDTFQDHHRAYVFYSNPLGIQSDSIYTEGQSYDFSFDTIWKSEGRLTADGYIVWLSIPFKSLRFSHAPEQTWGVALYRVILRKSEYDYWPYITQRVEGITQQFQPVGGLDHVSPGRNMQVIPYGLLANDHFLNQPALTSAGPPPSYQNAFEHRAGLDAKFVAKDALTFDVTLNPDFSQVETDDPQVTVNQRFAVL